MQTEKLKPYRDAGMPTLRTQRLVLRPFTPGDAADVQRVCGRREIADAAANIPHPYADGVAEEWIAKHAATFVEGTSVNLAVTLVETGEYIGGIGLIGISETHLRAEMGYVVAVEYWSRGYCTEAATAVLDYAFKEMGLHRVYAHHFARNPASGRVMQKIGMTYEGTLRHHHVKWGRFEDLVCYGICRE